MLSASKSTRVLVEKLQTLVKLCSDAAAELILETNPNILCSMLTKIRSIRKRLGR